MATLRQQNGNHPAYTFGGAWGELYDVSTARKIAAVYGQPFAAIRINEEFLRSFDDYAARAVYLSDGMHAAFGAHDVFFNERAKEIAPVRLTGKFGSEVVRIRNLVGEYTYETGFLNGPLQAVVGQLPTFRDTNPNGNHLTRVVTEEISWHEIARVAVEQSYITLRTPYMDNALVKLMYRAPQGSREAGDLQERYVKEYAPELATIITNLGRFASSSAALTKLAVLSVLGAFQDGVHLSVRYASLDDAR